jgi:DNA-binding transcriptional ArsR family regulator
MSRKTLKSAAFKMERQAALFAALGDKTRLSLVVRLTGGEPRSISNLARDSALTRQAVTKHLRVLEEAGLVRAQRQGRENLFMLEPRPFTELRTYLEYVSSQWDLALQRLKAFVEEEAL